MARCELPCTKCGREIPRSKLRKVYKKRATFLTLKAKDKYVDDGYYATCPGCNTKVTYETSYIEKTLGIKVEKKPLVI